MEDQQVRPVVENAATRAGEDAPIQPGRELLEVLAEQCDQFGMEGHRAGFAARPVLKLAALAGRSAVGPPCAAARLRVGEDQFAPAMDGQACEVVAAQVHGFFGPQRGVVQAAEEGDHPLAAFALLTDCGEQPCSQPPPVTPARPWPTATRQPTPSTAPSSAQRTSTDGSLAMISGPSSTRRRAWSAPRSPRA